MGMEPLVYMHEFRNIIYIHLHYRFLSEAYRGRISLPLCHHDTDLLVCDRVVSEYGLGVGDCKLSVMLCMCSMSGILPCEVLPL